MFYKKPNKAELYLNILCKLAASDKSGWSVFPTQLFCKIIIVAQIPRVVYISQNLR